MSRISRANNQIRPLRFELNYTKYAAGSVLVSSGYTRVICTATIENKVPPHRSGSGLGWVSAEYAMLPSATHSRNKRDSAGKVNARALEIQRLIGRALRSCIDFKLLGERQILIDCDVIQADGGTRVASINGGFVALSLAIQQLLAAGVITENPLKFHLAAISVGVVGDEVLLDLDYNEDSSCESDVNIILNEANDIIEIQGSAEGVVIKQAQLIQMLDMAKLATQQIIIEQKRVLLAN